MVNNSSELEDVCKTIKSLVIARKERTSLDVLRQDYKEIEGCNIPYTQYGFSTLKTFLQSMSQYVNVRNISGVDYVFHVETANIAHISKFVAEQKSTVKRSRGGKRGGAHYRPTRQFPVGGSTRCRLSAEELSNILKIVRGHPRGIAKQELLRHVHSRNRHSQINLSDLEHQLRELTHELAFENNMVLSKDPYKSSVTSFVPHQVVKNQSLNRAQNNKPTNTTSYQNKNIMPAGYETENGLYSEEEYYNDYYDYNENGTEALKLNPCTEAPQTVPKTVEDDDKANLISDRIKFRLLKLIEQYDEDGIWCAQLPLLYDKEYKVTLNYQDLGFDSVREMVSLLPDIFYMENPENARGDIKVYNAKTYHSKKEIINQKKTLASLHDICYDHQREPAVPNKMAKETSKRLIPCDVLSYKETVGQLNIDELKDDEVVVVCEIFDPSFFWVRPLESMKRFNELMKSISEFYMEKYKSYSIPPIILEKGLHIACKYNNIWHRGIVKSIRPDNFAYILFYDYGTVKLLSADDLYFLHRKFSNLPALAIPCGLYNLEPYDDDRWSKWVVAEFVQLVLDKAYSIKIKSKDEENNSLMVYLYTEENFLHSWMIQNKLASEGSVITKVDLENYELYEENQLALRKFAGPLIPALMKNRSRPSSPPLISPQSFMANDPPAGGQVVDQSPKPTPQEEQNVKNQNDPVDIQSACIHLIRENMRYIDELTSSASQFNDKTNEVILNEVLNAAKTQLENIQVQMKKPCIPNTSTEFKEQNPFKSSNPFLNSSINENDILFDTFIEKMSDESDILETAHVNGCNNFENHQNHDRCSSDAKMERRFKEDHINYSEIDRLDDYIRQPKIHPLEQEFRRDVTNSYHDSRRNWTNQPFANRSDSFVDDVLASRNGSVHQAVSEMNEQRRYKNGYIQKSVIPITLQTIISATVQILDLDNQGWMLTEEFSENFLNVRLHLFYVKIREKNINISFKIISRSKYPHIFEQLERNRVNVSKVSQINLISFKSMLLLLLKFGNIRREDLGTESIEGTELTIHQMYMKDYMALHEAYKNHQAKNQALFQNA